MRNLKKVLSLTLALVMMLGMMTFAGAAETAKKVTTSADLTDMKDVANKEAVSLLVDLKVVAGRDTGKFDPAGTLSRAEFAKMIYVAKMGVDDKAANFVGAATGLTDTKMWAEGYINYCFSTGIVSGRSATVFDPDGKVKTAEAAKMLLTALGYDAEAQGYVKDALWSVNVMQDAKKNGLMAGVKDASDAFLSRDSAAQMIFNALFAKTVTNERQKDFTGKWYVSKVTQNATTLGMESFDLAKVTASVNSIDSNGKAVLGTAASADFTSVGGLTLSAVLPGTPDMVGSTIAIYVKGVAKGTVLDVKSIYSAMPVVNASNVLATNYGLKSDTTASKSGTDALTALLVTEKTKVASLEAAGGSNIDTIAELHVFENGANKGAASVATTSVAKIGKYGIVTEFKDTNDVAGVDTVVITEKKVATLSAAPVVSGGKVTISSLAVANVETAKVIGYDGLAKDDVVLYVQMGGMTYIEKATMVEGVVSAAHNNKGILLGGTYYLTSELAGKANTWDNDFSNTYNLFLDNGKHIVKAVKVTDKAAASSFGILTNIALVKTDGVDGTHYVEGRMTHTDGTVEKIKIASINDVKVVLTSSKLAASASAKMYSYAPSSVSAHTSEITVVNKTFYYTNPKSTDVTAKYFGATDTAALTAPALVCTTTGAGAADGAAYADLGSFYEYTVNTDGTYALKNTASDNVKYASLANAVMNNGKAVFNGSNIGNSATVFIYETADSNGDPVYTVYKGIANAPATADNVKNPTPCLNTIVTNGAGVATFVFAKVAGTTTEAKDYIYFSDVANFGTVKDGSDTYYTYEAILNGKNETVKVAGKPTGGAGLYVCKNVSEKGVYTLTNVAAPVAANATGIKSVAGGSVILGNNSAYTYNSDTVAYYVNGDDVSTSVAPEAITLNAYDTVYVIDKNNDKNAEVIYVVYKAPYMTKWILTAFTSNQATSVVANLTDDVANTLSVATNANKVRFEATDVATATGTEFVSMSINDRAIAKDGSAFEILKADGATLTVKVVVKDNYSGAEDVITATIAVANTIA